MADEAQESRSKLASISDARRNSLPLSADERMAAGKKLRERVSRSSHAKWKPSAHRPDPLALLKESDHGRLPELLPIRYARMLQSPFAFLRGGAAVMASDLAGTPQTGLRVQACGDSHLSNLGGS